MSIINVQCYRLTVNIFICIFCLFRPVVLNYHPHYHEIDKATLKKSSVKGELQIITSVADLPIFRAPKVFPSTPNFRSDTSTDNLQNNLNPNYLFKSSAAGLLKPAAVSKSTGASSEKVYNDLYLKNNAHKQVRGEIK